MRKLLVANRSEIAIRVFRAATELGLETVAIYTYEDRFALHRFKADESYMIGPADGGEPVKGYLNIEQIVAVAKRHGVDAIHPGYGFLSENAELARACQREGIIFVGPTSEMLEAFGDKTAAKKLARKTGVPTIPGTEDALADPAEIKQAAKSIGFPLMIKASFGGGGRGMRVVKNAEELMPRLEECQREAGAAFGRPEVFLERYIPRAKHIEVQILGDGQGTIMHLWERDCSVQRRHQKVVEIAPSVNLPQQLREEICAAAVRLVTPMNYKAAGTVEFLVDLDKHEFFFIEVNPRIQVEHTVTEVVTGIDLVKSQILICQGHKLTDKELNIPPQDKIATRGWATQCRITTEDPENNFIPDYGRLTTYRSAAGFGVRLDGGSAFSGAVITPYFDSLLVKLTTYGSTFDESIKRMERALREFRIRGVKTNIPFLENLISHPKFLKGEATTTFIDSTPELFEFRPRRDRATKLLSYVGDVIVNGRSDVKGKLDPKKKFVTPVIPAFSPSPGTPGEGRGEGTPSNTKKMPSPYPSPGVPGEGIKRILPVGMRDKLLELGPVKFSQWIRKQRELFFTDTTMRDGHQSLLATRFRTHDMLQVADAVAHLESPLFSLEMWGGATFDTSMRFLQEDPWDRLDQLRAKIPNIPFQMLFRASNAVGYTNYPDNVIREFIKTAAAHGMDIFRIFDSLNWTEAMRVAMEAVIEETNSICEAAICYAGDILDPKRTKFTLKYYVKMAKELVKMGTHILAIKDMAGLCKPQAAYQLVKALRDEVDVPIHFHTHDTSGINAGTLLRASDAGVDIVDGAIASMSGTTSQPNLNSLVAAIANTPRQSSLNLETLDRLSDYWEAVREYYYPFEESIKSPSAEVYHHEMPGGQFTNLRQQAKALHLEDRWTDVANAYAEVNMLFGDIVKVTPSSKVVGDMALFMVTNGLSAAEVLDPKKKLSFPKSVVEMMQGYIGYPEGGWPKNIQKIILDSAGVKSIKGRVSAALPKADFAAAKKELAAKIKRTPRDVDVLSYLLYPQVYQDFQKHVAKYSDTSVLPTPAFLYGLNAGQEMNIEIEEGKTLIVRYQTTSDPREDGTRIVFFELNGQPREVVVTDQTIGAVLHKHPKADLDNPNHVAAPMPGKVSTVAVKKGEEVKEGQRLLSIEAMKMETAVYAPRAAKVADVLVKPGSVIVAKDLLVELE